MIPNKERLDVKGKKILEFLQDNGSSTYRQINNYLTKNNLGYAGEKALNRKLSDMIKEGLIERQDQKGERSKYRIRLDTDKILEIHSTYYKEYMRSQLIINSDKVFEEISNKNKIIDEEQNYLKKWIEFFGLYVFMALMESLAVLGKTEDNKQKNKEEHYKVFHTWLSNALSLEASTSRTSLTFEKMINDFKKTKNESNHVTQGRIIETMKKLYPQTAEIFLNMGMKSDEFLDIIKEQKYDSLTQLLQVFGILTGKTNKATRNELMNNARERKLSIKFNSIT